MNVLQYNLKPVVLILLFIVSSALAQQNPINYDEEKVGQYVLPDPLTFSDGRRVRDSADWRQRRNEILTLYRESVHGYSLPRPAGINPVIVEENRSALGGRAVRKQVEINVPGMNGVTHINLLMYLPAAAPGPVPCFLALSFAPPYQVYPDPAIRLTTTWDRKNRIRIAPQDSSRGTARGWDVDAVLARGYGMAIVYYCDLEPDFAGGWRYGVRGRSLPQEEDTLAPGAWGAIGVWAWGVSRAMDYLVADRDVDGHRVVLMGHSRLGKTVLWAAAQDERFAAVVASCSGEMGGALSRRNFGETIDTMLVRFPYWFCGNFAKYRGKVNELPVDSHFLLTLIAPRPVLLSTASQDLWADPRGEFLAEAAAEPVYSLLGAASPCPVAFPPLDATVGCALSFRCHEGKHEVTPRDWEAFVDFADRQLGANRGK